MFNDDVCAALIPIPIFATCQGGTLLATKIAIKKGKIISKAKRLVQFFEFKLFFNLVAYVNRLFEGEIMYLLHYGNDLFLTLQYVQFTMSPQYELKEFIMRLREELR
jgi:hypothetical protein